MRSTRITYLQCSSTFNTHHKSIMGHPKPYNCVRLFFVIGAMQVYNTPIEHEMLASIRLQEKSLKLSNEKKKSWDKIPNIFCWPVSFVFGTIFLDKINGFFTLILFFLSFSIPVMSNPNWYIGGCLESFVWLSMDHSKDNFRNNYLTLFPYPPTWI